jgi:hypothetical protein
MGYTWILDLGMIAVDIYFAWKERNKKPLPKIVGSVQCPTCRFGSGRPAIGHPEDRFTGSRGIAARMDGG